MWFLEEFKVSEILCVTIICTFSFDTKCVHYTMETPINFMIGLCLLQKPKYN
jgi:hypothetical protein